MAEKKKQPMSKEKTRKSTNKTQQKQKSGELFLKSTLKNYKSGSLKTKYKKYNKIICIAFGTNSKTAGGGGAGVNCSGVLSVPGLRSRKQQYTCPFPNYLPHTAVFI